MANQELDIIIRAKNEATKVFKEAEKSVASFEKSVNQYFKEAADDSRSFALAMTPIVAGFGAVLT